MMVLSSLFPLVILAAVGYGLYRILATRDRDPGDASTGDLREQAARFFRLALLAIALVLSTEGVAQLIGQILPRPDTLADDSTALAQALSFTIVGLPALYGLARWTRHRLSTDPDDPPSVSWALYLGVTVTVALIATLANAHTTLRWVVGLDAFDGDALGRTAAWGAVFAVHLVLNRRRPLVDRHRAIEARTPLYLLTGSLIGLVVVVIGGWNLLRATARPLYDLIWTDVLAGDGTGPVLNALIDTVLGGVVWGWFWLRQARPAPRTQRWYAYVLLAGVLGGLVGLLTAAGVLLNRVLQWFFADPGAGAADHFSLLPGTGAAALVGLALWAHHRHTLSAAPVHRNEVDRIYTYLAAFVGLVVSAIAVTLVVAAFIDAVIDADAISRSAADPVVLAVTFLTVGLPVWAVFWRRAERNAADDLSELRSPSRRLYLLTLLGLSAAVALVSLVVLLTIFLEDLTEGELAAETVRRLRVPLGLVLSSAAVAGYHLLVYRDDRRASPPPPPPERRVREVVLISDLEPGPADELAQALGGRVVRFTTVAPGPAPDAATLARAVAEVGALTAGRALVTVRKGAIEVQGLR